MEWTTVTLATVDSTMAEAARRAPDLLGPTWILAHEQTASRGRRGREWKQGAGNFAATLVIEAGPPDQAALRSFVAALALSDAFEALGVRGVSLKWPNDVLVHGTKVAGILLESLPHNRLAIGIGVNLRTAPQAGELEETAVQPGRLESDATPEDMLELLAPAYAAWERQFLEFGFAPIRTAWLAKAARLGAVIRARTAQDEYDGTFETIDNSGQLVLSTAKGRLSIPAADVYF